MKTQFENRTAVEKFLVRMNPLLSYYLTVLEWYDSARPETWVSRGDVVDHWYEDSEDMVTVDLGQPVNS